MEEIGLIFRSAPTSHPLTAPTGITMKRTDDEKAIVWRVLKQVPTRIGIVFDYGVYVVPTLLVAVYGWFSHEWIALLVV